MKYASMLILIAGMNSGVHAQDEEFPITSGTVMYIPPDAPPVFSGRSVVRVWGTNASNFRGYNTPAPATRAANDFDFAGGPAENVVGNVRLVGSYFAVITPAGTTNIRCDVRVSVYTTFGGWIDSTFPGSNLAGQGTLVGWELPPGAPVPPYIDPNTNIAMPLGDVLNVAGADGMFMIEIFETGTNTLHPTSWTPATIGTALNVGTSDPQRWGDSFSPDGSIGPDGLVQPLNGTEPWEVNLPTVTGGRAIYGGLWADLPSPVTCDSIDFNNDTSLFDPQDIEAFLSVYSEGPCVPVNASCNDIDFNNDTSLFDPCDINSFLTQYAEGPCTMCRA